MDGICWYHLWFLSVKYFISAGTPGAQAWTCLWHGLMLMWVFRAPPLHSYFSFPHMLWSTLLWSTTCIYLFPTFWFYGKKSSHGATDGRIRAENCLLFGRAHKSRLRIPQAHKPVSSTSYQSSPSCWWSTYATASPVREGELPLPPALAQLIKLKFINFNSADPKLVLENVFGSGRLTWPQVTPDAPTQVWRQESCVSSRRFAKATLLIAEAGGETGGSFPQARLSALARASVSPSLKQRQPWLTMSAIEEITTLHSLLLTLEWHFLYQEWAPQQGI